MPQINDKLRNRIIDTLQYMKAEAPCTTTMAIAKKLNVTWDKAHTIIKHLLNAQLAIAIYLDRRMIVCLSKKEAAAEIAALKREIWRTICTTKRRFIKPSIIAKQIANDPHARKVFAKYINVNHVNGNSLQFITDLLEHILGPPIEKTSRAVRFYVPREYCEKEPPIKIPIKTYKSTYRNVTFKVPDYMYTDMINATRHMNITMSQLVTMAIARLLQQYQHTQPN